MTHRNVVQSCFAAQSLALSECHDSESSVLSYLARANPVVEQRGVKITDTRSRGVKRNLKPAFASLTGVYQPAVFLVAPPDSMTTSHIIQ